MSTTNNFAQKQAKEVAPIGQKVRTALNWIVNILCVILIIFALIVAIFTIVRSTNGDRLTKFGNKVYMNVASYSMEPTFSENDVIIVDYYDGDGTDLQVGQVITFKFARNGYESFNTHRIMAIDNTMAIPRFRTRGDKMGGDWQDALEDESTWDPGWVSADIIIGTWGKVDKVGEGEYVFTPGKVLKGVGSFANWIQDPEEGKTRFFCVVVLPLILLFVIYAFVLVRTLIIAKLENNKKVEGENVMTVDSLSDEEKKRLAMEYLASLNAQGDAPKSETTSEEENIADVEQKHESICDETSEVGAPIEGENVSPSNGEAVADDTDELPADIEEGSEEQ